MGELNNFFSGTVESKRKKFNFSHLVAKKESSLENLMERKFKDLISATLRFLENNPHKPKMAAIDLELFEDKPEAVQKRNYFTSR